MREGLKLEEGGTEAGAGSRGIGRRQELLLQEGATKAGGGRDYGGR